MVARATFELNGPTTPRTLVLPTMSVKFCAPFCGSCTPFTASSYGLCVILKPLMLPLSWTAYATPASGPRPLARSAPDVGKLLAMMISPLSAPPPLDGAACPHAAATIAMPARIAVAESQRLCMVPPYNAIFSDRGPLALSPRAGTGPRLIAEPRSQPRGRQSNAGLSEEAREDPVPAACLHRGVRDRGGLAVAVEAPRPEQAGIALRDVAQRLQHPFAIGRAITRASRRRDGERRRVVRLDRLGVGLASVAGLVPLQPPARVARVALERDPGEPRVHPFGPA